MILQKRLFFPGCLLFVVLLSSFAFVNKTYVWDQYKLELSAPDGFRVTQNTNEEFGVEGDGMQIKINSFEQDVSTDDLGDATLEAANTLKLEAVGEQQEIETANLEGFYVEGLLKEDRVMLAAVMDPNSHTNFLIVITFDDEDERAETDAFEILSSVRRRN